MNSVVESFVEVRLGEPQDFLKIKETLTRMGLAVERDDGRYLYQSCHILHKRGRYYITHFKEMMILDGKQTDMDDVDRARRNTIAYLLAQWGLCEVIDRTLIEQRVAFSDIKVIPHKEKGSWKLVSKYTVGKKRNDDDPAS